MLLEVPWFWIIFMRPSLMLSRHAWYAIFIHENSMLLESTMSGFKTSTTSGDLDLAFGSTTTLTHLQDTITGWRFSGQTRTLILLLVITLRPCELMAVSLLSQSLSLAFIERSCIFPWQPRWPRIRELWSALRKYHTPRSHLIVSSHRGRFPVNVLCHRKILWGVVVINMIEGINLEIFVKTNCAYKTIPVIHKWHRPCSQQESFSLSFSRGFVTIEQASRGTPCQM